MTPLGSVGVLGSGLMGSGIAQAAAAAGYRTVVRDTVPDQLVSGRKRIAASLARLVEKGKLAPDIDRAALDRLTFSVELADLAGCDLIIEAVTEDFALKAGLWRELDPVAGPSAIFASNTSSLSIAAQAAVTARSTWGPTATGVAAAHAARSAADSPPSGPTTTHHSAASGTAEIVFGGTGSSSTVV